MADRSRIGIVTGLAAEAGTLPESDLWIALSAADPARAAQAADAMIAGGAQLLVSYGLAAGLDPRLGPGTLLLPDSVISHEGEVETPDRGGVRDQLNRITSFKRDEGAGTPEPPPPESYLAVDQRVREALRQGLEERAEGGAVAGVDRPLMYGDQKLALYAQTRALAADMESHLVARAAVAAGVPYVVIRVVSDPSNRTVPHAAIAGITEDGRIDGWAMAGGLARRPWECFDLMTLALDGAQAMRRLRRVGRRAMSLLADL